MIAYDRLWKTMKDRGISQYKLIHEYKFSAGQLSHIRKNESITTYTLSTLCKILDCKLEDIAEYVPDKEENKQ